MLQANASRLKIYTPQVSESSNFLGQAHLSACVRQIVEGFCSFFFGKLNGSAIDLRRVDMPTALRYTDTTSGLVKKDRGSRPKERF